MVPAAVREVAPKLAVPEKTPLMKEVWGGKGWGRRVLFIFKTDIQNKIGKLKG